MTHFLHEVLWDKAFRINTLESYFREFHKKDDPILWDGHLARPCVVSGQDARTTRDFGIFF